MVYAYNLLINKIQYSVFPSFIHSQRTKKENITCTMDDVRGDFLGPPHGTTPAAVIANKN